MKALKNALALDGWNSGAVVLDAHDHLVASGGNPGCDLTALVCVPNRIIEKIAQHLLEQHRIAFDRGGRTGILEAEIDVAFKRARNPLGRGVTHNVIEVDALQALSAVSPGFGPGERQQLIDKVGGL